MPDISPFREEIRCRAGFRQSPMRKKVLPAKLLISPLEGEMAGRPEGGVTRLNLRNPRGRYCDN
ncbi:propionyl-coenzyme A carboxylase alpha polypeptide [Mesorhizobium sp. B4-1-3]|nr:propionyl-coenzyme A carboxylase alpha polypeptide [Mesorhizobium sp. B4-1-3]